MAQTVLLTWQFAYTLMVAQRLYCNPPKDLLFHTLNQTLFKCSTRSTKFQVLLFLYRAYKAISWRHICLTKAVARGDNLFFRHHVQMFLLTYFTQNIMLTAVQRLRCNDLLFHPLNQTLSEFWVQYLQTKQNWQQQRKQRWVLTVFLARMKPSNSDTVNVYCASFIAAVDEDVLVTFRRFVQVPHTVLNNGSPSWLQCNPRHHHLCRAFYRHIGNTC